jgi:hypothetical protein
MRTFAAFLLAAVLGAIVLLPGCEGGTPAKPGPSGPGLAKTQEPVTVLYTGREAFQKLYATARMWTGDAQPFRLQSEVFKDSTGMGGKSVIWRAGFASATRRAIRNFVWSGSHSDDGPGFGVSSGSEDSYSPTNSSTLVFDTNFLKTDSDKAFEVAQQHGGERLTAKDPKQPVFYILAWDPSHNALIWHVVYGPSEPEAKLRVAVDASRGAFVRVEK